METHEKQKAGRVSKFETEQRVEQVQALIAACVPKSSILQGIAQKWGIQRRQAEYYYAKACEAFRAQRSNEDKAEEYAKVKARLELAAHKLFTRQDYRGFVMAIRELATLQGLLSAKLELGGYLDVVPASVKAELTPDRMESLLQAFQASKTKPGGQ